MGRKLSCSQVLPCLTLHPAPPPSPAHRNTHFSPRSTGSVVVPLPAMSALASLAVSSSVKWARNAFLVTFSLRLKKEMHFSYPVMADVPSALS